MRKEMARARSMWPGLSPEQVLAMATVHGAAALGRGRLGTLRPGDPASFLMVPAPNGIDASLDAFTAGQLDPEEIRLLGSPWPD
jgi:cytosine/adenosine deaminase-related metal-dependent hydrolase